MHVEKYFILTSISYENTKALFAKNNLSDTAHTWYDSQGYNQTMVKFAIMKSRMLDYFIPSDYIRRARRVLVACKMGQRSATEYTDDFRKHLVNCRDIYEPEAIFIFDTNIANWLSSLVLPYACNILQETMLCT